METRAHHLSTNSQLEGHDSLAAFTLFLLDSLREFPFHETHLLSVFFDVDSDRDGNIPIPQRYVTQLLLKASRKDYPFGTAAEMGENEVRAERQKVLSVFHRTFREIETRCRGSDFSSKSLRLH